MKKILNKISDKASSAKDKVTKPFRKPEPTVPSRITTDTLAEHRERVLAGGRRFKYPLQYARHKLVFNTIIIGVALIIALVVIIWMQLYQFQNSNDITYRITRVVPVPVAVVDGESVRYSDYLMRYRSAIHYKKEKEQVNFDSADGKLQAGHIKRQELNNAISDAYANKLAKERGIMVTDEELQSFLKRQRSTATGEVSEATYNAVIQDYYNWSPDEYEQVMRAKLLHQKVAYDIDEDASKAVKMAEDLIKSGNTSLKEVADKVNKTSAGAATFGNSGNVPKTNQDGGLAAAAAKLSKGGVSAAIKPTGGNGYYIVKLISSDNNNVNYDFIHIPLKIFQTWLDKLESDGKIREYISVPKE